MLGSIKHRFESYFERVTSNGRVYIFLTPRGWYFCLIIFVLFIISLSYANSLAYFSTFLFLSIVWISCIVTNYNLYDLEVDKVFLNDYYYKGDFVELEAELYNKGSKERFDIALEGFRLTGPIYQSLKTNSSGHLSLKLPFDKAGLFKVKGLKLVTSFPFGLFKSWKFFKFNKEVLILPQPIIKPLPKSLAEREGREKRDHGQSDFSQHQKYDNEGPSKIDWKVLARRGELYSKKFQEDIPTDYLFSLSDLEGALEDKKAILVHWLFSAENLKRYYALKLGSLTIELGRGKEHLMKCLKEVVSYEEVRG